MAKSRDYAVRMLEVLEDQYGHWMTVKGVLMAAGISATLKPMQLATLHQLAKIGTVERRKGHNGAFVFRLLTHDWSRITPLLPVAGMKPLDDGDCHEEDEEQPAPSKAATGESNGHLAKLIVALAKQLDDTKSELGELRDKYSRANGSIEIKQWDGEIVKLKGVTLPAVFQDILDLASQRENIMLVGPAGCGKTHVAKLIADSLKLEFGSLSCSAGMSETHLLGRSTPDFHEGKAKFQGTEFLRIYENGGVFLLDEVDAADANLLLAANSALANDYCNVPNRPSKPRAIRHDNFIMIATANTYGRGATRVYAGRNQLDEATLDRFRVGTVEMGYDRTVEEQQCPVPEIREHLWKVRDKIEAAGLRRVLSTRFLKQAAKMHKGAGWSLEKIVNVFFNGWSEDEKSKAYVALPRPESEPGQAEAEFALALDKSAVAEQHNGDWHCSVHGPMIRMTSNIGWRCRASGKWDTTAKKFSGCPCCKFDKSRSS